MFIFYSKLMRLKLLLNIHQTIFPGAQFVRGLRLPQYQVRNINIFYFQNNNYLGIIQYNCM